MRHSFSATLLRQFEVAYYLCPKCGFLRTEEPYWLEQAYYEAIAVTDTGLVQRNNSIAMKLAALIYFELDSRGIYVDVAGGYGLLVRIMRDLGFDFFWSDKFCQNLFARGFEVDKASGSITALTAIEVLEHVHDPLAFITQEMETFGSRTLIFSTELYQGASPPKNWWYYSFANGQHISFYKLQTLQFIAERLGLKIYSAHGIHMLTDKLINKQRFNFLTGICGPLAAFIIKRRMHSRTMADHDHLQAADRNNI